MDDFATACAREARPAMDAVVERLRQSGGDGLVEELPGGEAWFRSPRSALWTSLKAIQSMNLGWTATPTRCSKPTSKDGRSKSTKATCGEGLAEYQPPSGAWDVLKSRAGGSRRHSGDRPPVRSTSGRGALLNRDHIVR